MAIFEFPATFSNEVADLFDDKINGGASNGKLQFTSAGDTSFSSILLEITLANPAHSNAAGKVITLLGTPIAATFSGDGTIALGRYVDGDGTEWARGNATITSGGGAFILDTVDAVTGFPVNLVSGSIQFLGSTL